MLDEKRIKQIESRVRNFLSDGAIQKTKKIEYVDFFLENWRLLQLGVKHIKTYKSYGNFRLHG